MAVSLLSCSHTFPRTFLIFSRRSPSSPAKILGGLPVADGGRLFPFRKVHLLRSHFLKQGEVLADDTTSACNVSRHGEAVNFIPKFFDHQEMMASAFARIFLIANTIMLLLPAKVLAETCEADNSVFSMPLLSGVAFIGATVGGLLARQRKEELKRVNDQLRQINAALRRQAKIESYAPNLSYTPVLRAPEHEVIVDPKKEELVAKLRSGKNHLRNQDLGKAFMEFTAALDLAKALGDHVEEKKAARGLGASLQRQGKYKEAIKYHSKVLDISERVKEDSGTTEAYGAIADCYTELGDLEQAGSFYDKYIARLECD